MLHSAPDFPPVFARLRRYLIAALRLLKENVHE
jgi:hypothetical protein